MLAHNFLYRKLIIYKQFLVDIFCPFELSYYPFDRQNCLIVLINDGEKEDNVILEPEKLTYSGPKDLLQYFIEESVFIPKDGKNAIVIKIGFGRRFMNVMLTAILPAILIDMVCFLK